MLNKAYVYVVYFCVFSGCVSQIVSYSPYTRSKRSAQASAYLLPRLLLYSNRFWDWNFVHVLQYSDRFRTYTRTQTKVLDSVEFPCNVTGFRSAQRPESVHRVKPGDIDVVAALGDSLTAGIGAMTANLAYLINPSRGVTFPMGGDSTWREFLTLPNILKEFNPKLRGYSTGDGSAFSKQAYLNAAENAACDEDMIYQAAELVKKIKQDKHIDIIRDWKMITVFIGHNDLCSLICHKSAGNQTGAMHRANLQETLDYLQAKLPRTIVNLVSVLDVSLSLKLRQMNTRCEIFHSLFCSCSMDPDTWTPSNKFISMIKSYWKAEEELINSGRYDKKKDFTVILHTFTKHIQEGAFTNKNGDFDWSAVGPDCFHFSQKTHSAAAFMLWKSLLSPEGMKPTEVKAQESSGRIELLACPSHVSPFFFTRKNSEWFHRTGFQYEH